MRRFWLLQSILILLTVLPLAAFADSGVSDEQALNFLQERLKADHLYSNIDCILFLIEDQNSWDLIIGLREKHDEKCAGDTDVAPLIDRYRVTRSTKKIEWYDAIEDDYQPLSEAIKKRKTK